jgi:hypothetical protein
MTLDKTRFTLRLDDNILEKIKIISEQNRRSVNAQIEYFLEQCVIEYEKQNGVIKISNE